MLHLQGEYLQKVWLVCTVCRLAWCWSVDRQVDEGEVAGVRDVLIWESQQHDPLNNHQEYIYMLNITSSSPAAFFSTLTFRAELNSIDTEGVLEFSFCWANNANKEKQYGEEECVSVQEKSMSWDCSFAHSEHVTTGDYMMFVRVFNGSAPTPAEWLTHRYLSESFTRFHLRDYLIGDLNLSQNLSVVQVENVYSTGHNMTIHIKMQDDIINGTFMYFLHVSTSKPIVINTTEPQFDIMIPETGTHDLEVKVTAYIHNQNPDGSVGLDAIEGNFSKSVMLRNPVSDIKLTMIVNENLYPGDRMQGNITCHASGPVELCFDMVGPDNRTQINYTCVQADQVSRGVFSVGLNHKMSLVGVYTLHVTTTNIVSINSTKLAFHVVQKPGPGIPALPIFIPLACFVIFFTVLASVGYAYHRDRQRRHIETADFTFYSGEHTTNSQPNVVLEKIKDGFKYVVAVLSYRRKNYWREKHQKYRDTTAARYGAIQEDNLTL